MIGPTLSLLGDQQFAPPVAALFDDDPVDVVPDVPDCPQGALPFPPSPLPCPEAPDSPELLVPLPEPEPPEPLPALLPLDEPLSEPELEPPELPEPLPCANADVAMPIVSAATASNFIMGCFLISPTRSPNRT